MTIEQNIKKKLQTFSGISESPEAIVKNSME